MTRVIPRQFGDIAKNSAKTGGGDAAQSIGIGAYLVHREGVARRTESSPRLKALYRRHGDIHSNNTSERLVALKLNTLLETFQDNKYYKTHMNRYVEHRQRHGRHHPKALRSTKYQLCDAILSKYIIPRNIKHSNPNRMLTK